MFSQIIVVWFYDPPYKATNIFFYIVYMDLHGSIYQCLELLVLSDYVYVHQSISEGASWKAAFSPKQLFVLCSSVNCVIVRPQY